MLALNKEEFHPRCTTAPKSSIKILNNIPHVVGLKNTKNHGRNPDKDKSGPPL